MSQRLLLIDNYDSFTYNLVQAFLILGAEVEVHRNDAIDVRQALAGKLYASGHFSRPRHAARGGRFHAHDRGICRAPADFRRLSRSPIPGRSVRRQGGAGSAP